MDIITIVIISVRVREPAAPAQPFPPRPRSAWDGGGGVHGGRPAAGHTSPHQRRIGRDRAGSRHRAVSATRGRSRRARWRASRRGARLRHGLREMLAPEQELHALAPLANSADGASPQQHEELPHLRPERRVKTPLATGRTRTAAEVSVPQVLMCFLCRQGGTVTVCATCRNCFCQRRVSTCGRCGDTDCEPCSSDHDWYCRGRPRRAETTADSPSLTSRGPDAVCAGSGASDAAIATCVAVHTSLRGGEHVPHASRARGQSLVTAMPQTPAFCHCSRDCL